MPKSNHTLHFWHPSAATGYGLLNWIPLTSVSCRMIARFVQYDTIRYILGITGESRRQLRKDPTLQISGVDYVFIDSAEWVRASLLSNPVLEDLLDLLVYCHRVPGTTRPVTPPFQRQNYLAENAVANWARDAPTPRGGAPQPGTRAEAGKQQAQETPHPSFSMSFGGPSDVSDTIEGGDSRVSQLPSPGGDHSESPTNPISLDVKSVSLLNIQQPSELRRCPTQGNTVQKCRA